MICSQTARSFEMIMIGRLLYGINSGEYSTRGIDISFFICNFFKDGCFIPLCTLINPTDNRFLSLPVTETVLSAIFHTVIDHYWLFLKCMIPLCVSLQDWVSPLKPCTSLSAPPRGCGGWWAWRWVLSFPWGSLVVSCWGSGEVTGVMDTVRGSSECNKSLRSIRITIITIMFFPRGGEKINN